MASTASNSLNITSDGLVKFANPATFSSVTTTQYNVLTGSTSNGINNVAPSSTSGNPLVSQGSSSQPIFSSTPTVTSITISNAPSSGTDGTNKTYVDTAIAAVNPATSVYAATTTNIPGTYTSVASGIGDTFLTTATGAFTLDGTSPPVASRILFKDQTSPGNSYQNGVYTLTTNGTGITGTLFTRALDYDQPSDINSTGVIAVLNGTVNKLTGWLINVNVTTVGTDPITYTKYNNAPITTTQYAVLVGDTANGIASVSPSSTSGIPLVSNGASSNPSFTTAVVAGGGTGQTTLTNHGVLIGAGTTAITQLSAGSAGQVLQSGGASADPSYSTPTYPSASGATGVILRSDGTNYLATTNTYPNTATTGDILIATGSNVIGSLAAVATGQVLTSAGTSTAPAYSATPTVTSITFGSGNALNTYVTATWTPNIQINSSSTGITYTTQTGGYTRIGNVVTIWASITLSSKGASTGVVTISNLPISTSSSGGSQSIAVSEYNAISSAGYTSIGLRLANSSAVGVFIKSSASGSGLLGLTNSDISNTFYVQFSGSYILD